MCHGQYHSYTALMPKLWSDTIEAHRRAVREAALDTTAALVARSGLRSVTMGRIAEQAGIGRATLYKYFPDVDAILRAWHERQLTDHLGHLEHVRDGTSDPRTRLDAVLAAYAHMSHHGRAAHDAELSAALHGDEQVARAERRLLDLIEALLAEAMEVGDVRNDVPAAELAAYCVHALGAAGTLRTRQAIERLVAVTLAGLRSRPSP